MVSDGTATMIRCRRCCWWCGVQDVRLKITMHRCDVWTCMSAANACWIVLCKCMLDIKCSVLRGWSCAITKSFEFWLRTDIKDGVISLSLIMHRPPTSCIDRPYIMHRPSHIMHRCPYIMNRTPLYHACGRRCTTVCASIHIGQFTQCDPRYRVAQELKAPFHKGSVTIYGAGVNRMRVYHVMCISARYWAMQELKAPQGSYACVRNGSTNRGCHIAHRTGITRVCGLWNGRRDDGKALLM